MATRIGDSSSKPRRRRKAGCVLQNVVGIFMYIYSSAAKAEERDSPIITKSSAL